MNPLNFVQNLGLKITWKLITVGLYCYGNSPPITRQEVLDFLDLCLLRENTQANEIISVICEENDTEAMDAKLEELSEHDRSELSLQKRKWRVYLLIRLLEKLGTDPLQGLLALMEFWLPMRDTGCPITFPCNNGSPSVEEYFTKSNYETMVKRNRAWLHKEIGEIQQAESLLCNCL